MIPIQKEIRSRAYPEKAKILAGFFKTGEGEYGEGDFFLGLTVPQSRSIAKSYQQLSFPDIEVLFASKYHEERLVALLVLVGQFQAGDNKQRQLIYNFYLAHFNRINNWDLIDLSADKIVGMYLFEQGKKVPQKLIRSKNLWERRAAIVATFAFIKRGDASETFRVIECMFHDTEDLIQKASGWMLREAGKRVSRRDLIVFLKKNGALMPRTMLRYAIEHFSPEERRKWLSVRRKMSSIH